VWFRHWGLAGDPFLEGEGTYVPLLMHEEAVARLVYTIESGRSMAVLSGAPGLGKSGVLGRAIAEVRAPLRRIAFVSSPTDGESMFETLAQGLGSRRTGPGSAGGSAFHRLQREVRICALQGIHVVLAVDDCHMLAVSDREQELSRIRHLIAPTAGRVTVLLTWDEGEAEDPISDRSWNLAVRLKPLTRSEAETYLSARLAQAGGLDPIFTRRAVTRLHALSRGVPRDLDRLASLSLMAGASRGLEAVSSEVVDAVISLERFSLEWPTV
jgi:MSHA biogenesis protein MshM